MNGNRMQRVHKSFITWKPNQLDEIRKITSLSKVKQFIVSTQISMTPFFDPSN